MKILIGIWTTPFDWDCILLHSVGFLPLQDPLPSPPRFFNTLSSAQPSSHTQPTSSDTLPAQPPRKPATKKKKVTWTSPSFQTSRSGKIILPHLITPILHLVELYLLTIFDDPVAVYYSNTRQLRFTRLNEKISFQSSKWVCLYSRGLFYITGGVGMDT